MIQHRDTEGSKRITEGPYHDLSERVIGAAIEVHKILGPGLLESAYEACLCRELELHGCHVKRQIYVDLQYKGVQVKRAYRIDVMIDDLLLLEIKAVEEFPAIHKLQMLTYLKLTGKPIGLIINFNVPVLWKGVRRLLNNQ